MESSLFICISFHIRSYLVCLSVHTKCQLLINAYAYKHYSAFSSPHDRMGRYSVNCIYLQKKIFYISHFPYFSTINLIY